MIFLSSINDQAFARRHFLRVYVFLLSVVKVKTTVSLSG